MTAFDLRAVDLRALNSMTKYPSIPTYHELDPETGGLLDEVTTFRGPVLGTEKVDGTSARIVALTGGGWLIGSREEWLTASGDLIPNPALGIVDALGKVAASIVMPWNADPLTVYYLEVYGGKVGAAAKQYTADPTQVGWRLFDVAVFRDWAEVLSWPREKIAAWRDGGGQPFVDEETLQALAWNLGLDLTPRLFGLPGSEIPTGIQETRDFLTEHSASTRVCARRDGRPFGRDRAPLTGPQCHRQGQVPGLRPDTEAPGRWTVRDVLAEIDAAVDGRCACGCGTALDPNGPSAYYLNANHQSRWQESQATDPQDVYNRPDAAAYPRLDSAPVGLREPVPSATFRRLHLNRMVQSSNPETYWPNADTEDARVEAAWSSGPAIMLDRREPPIEEAWTDDFRDPVVAAGLSLATYGYRRLCHRCGKLGIPRLWIVPSTVRLDWYDQPVVSFEQRRGHGCQFGCGVHRGRPVWAQVRPGDSGGMVVQFTDDPSTGWLTLQARDPFWYGGGDHRSVMDFVWREAELHLEERRRPPCALHGCGEKARETFTVQPRSPLLGRLHLCGRFWDPGDKMELCPQHAYLLRRGEDPAHPGEMVDELVDSPMSLWLVSP